jgi:hypothetical protein
MFQKETGLLEAAMYEHDWSVMQAQATRMPVGVFMAADSSVYLVSTEASVLMISSFQYTGEAFSLLSPSYSVRYSSQSIKGSSVKPDSSSFLVSGSLDNKVSLFKFNTDDGSNLWVASLQDVAGVSNSVILSEVDY